MISDLWFLIYDLGVGEKDEELNGNKVFYVKVKRKIAIFADRKTKKEGVDEASESHQNNRDVPTPYQLRTNAVPRPFA